MHYLGGCCCKEAFTVLRTMTLVKAIQRVVIQQQFRYSGIPDNFWYCCANILRLCD